MGGGNEKRKAKKVDGPNSTYCGKETRMVTKLFKNTNVKVAYRTKTTEDTKTRQIR